MFEDERALAIAREWSTKAENDLRTAVQTLKLGARTPTDTVCFHAQQCVEKLIKALLTSLEIDFTKTHDLGILVALIPDRMRPSLTVAELRTLTAYATITRYPGDYEPITLEDARQAVELARRTRRETRKFLPKKLKV